MAFDETGNDRSAAGANHVRTWPDERVDVAVTSDRDEHPRAHREGGSDAG